MNLTFLKERECPYCKTKHFGLSCPTCGSHRGGNELEPYYYVVSNTGMSLSGITEKAIVDLLEQHKLTLTDSISVDGKDWYPIHEVITIGGKTLVEREQERRYEQQRLEQKNPLNSVVVIIMIFFAFLLILFSFYEFLNRGY